MAGFFSVIYGGTAGLTAFTAIVACLLCATRLTRVKAHWRSWYMAFTILTTITTLLGVASQSLRLAFNIAWDESDNPHRDYNRHVYIAFIFTDITYQLFLNASQLGLFCTILMAGVGSDHSKFQKISRLIVYMVGGLLLVISFAKFAVECKYYLYLTNVADPYHAEEESSSVAGQVLVSVRLDTAFKVMMLVASIGAIVHCLLTVFSPQGEKRVRFSSDS
ncbi:hypothetical protein VHEMI07156 [[Torrubiella] hemipterigena]|uniref:Uncharacterized protein n=1 Tax=[Torrubiella] hemipterigena TaxID=1531966 RepID=A0A0A1T2M8_9HYPO|nr:hypothetical protein VHEMI07156 [[Torrubiella] hemipterigena]